MIEAKHCWISLITQHRDVYLGYTFTKTERGVVVCCPPCDTDLVVVGGTNMRNLVHF